MMGEATKRPRRSLIGWMGLISTVCVLLVLGGTLGRRYFTNRSGAERERAPQEAKADRIKAAQAALDEAIACYNLYPDEFETRALFEEIDRKWPETAAAAIARVKAKDIEAGVFPEVSKPSTIRSSVTRRDYDSAIRLLREFAARHPDIEAGNEALAEADRLEKEIEGIYRTLEEEVNQRVEKQEYGLAIALLDQFTNSYKSVKWGAEAAKLKAKIQQRAMENHQKSTSAAHEWE